MEQRKGVRYTKETIRIYREVEGEMTIIAQKFRLYPTKEQEEKLLLILEQCRWVYNKLLSIINESKSTPPKRKMQSLLPKLKE